MSPSIVTLVRAPGEENVTGVRPVNSVLQQEVTMRFIRWFTLPLVAVLLLFVWQPHSAADKHPDGDPTSAEYGPTDYAVGAPGFSVRKFEPGLADNPDWLAGQAVTTVVSPDKKTLLVLTSGYNRIYRTNLVNGVLQPDAGRVAYFNWPDSQVVCVRLRHLDEHTGQAAGRDGPEHLQRHRLRPVWHGVLRVQRHGRRAL